MSSVSGSSHSKLSMEELNILYAKMDQKNESSDDVITNIPSSVTSSVSDVLDQAQVNIDVTTPTSTTAADSDTILSATTSTAQLQEQQKLDAYKAQILSQNQESDTVKTNARKMRNVNNFI